MMDVMSEPNSPDDADDDAAVERPYRPRASMRTRVLMVGVFLGAIVAMSVSWVFSWGIDTPEERAREAKEQAMARREAAFTSPPGSCLRWSAADASDVRKVSCTSEHLFEVVGTADISDAYPRDAKRPDSDGLRDLAAERCGRSAGDYLKRPLDPFGKLAIGVLQPDQRQWAAGERTLHCGLQWAGPGGELQQLSKPASKIDQSNVWEPGTCLALADKSVGDPVDCDEQHSYEIVGVADLGKEFDGFPSIDDQQAWLDETCSDIAGRYTGKADLGEKGLILTWDVREKPSWKAGSKLVNCKVGAKLEDDSGLAPVRGSVAKQEPPPSKDKGDGSDGSDGGKKDGPHEQLPVGGDSPDSGNSQGSESSQNGG